MTMRRVSSSRWRIVALGTALLVVDSMAAGGRSVARAQAGRAVNQRPPQAPGTPNDLSPYGMPRFGGWYSPYPVKDPTADERAVIAGRIYRSILDESAQRAMTAPRKDQPPAPDSEARSSLELAERLGPWSLRWQEAQDNAAKSRAIRYQAMSDHLGRMSALEDGRYRSATRPATAGPKPSRGAGEVARFFRPVDQWAIDQIIPTPLVSERPLNPRGVAITPTGQVDIADWVYHAILDEAVDRFLTSPPGGTTPPDEAPIFDGLLAERLGFWSDLWRQSQDFAAREPSRRSPSAGDGPARASSAAARTVGPVGPTTTMRSHIDRMSELESGQFVDVTLKRSGRSAVPPVDMTRFRAFTDVVRFFRIDAESRLSTAAPSRGTDIADSGPAATAARIYRAIVDDAARRFREAPRAGEAARVNRPVVASCLAERLAAWSIRWARAEIRANPARVSPFNAIQSHTERMASLEDGRSFRDPPERAAAGATAVAAATPPREAADVARFFRLEALWELAQVRSR
jgi:hypothetical protein